ncbi:MAG: zinc-binding dehydrogenase [Desulfobacteraceae bacterium]|nr:zinc-binding dehydrogenase [Desulfobacteraceae bacterium]
MAGVAAARESGAGKIFLIGLDRDRNRLEMGRRFGCDEIIVAEKHDTVALISEATNGRMANVVMDASGHPSRAELALMLTGRRGTLVLPGLYGCRKVPLDLDIAVTREIKITGVFSHDSKGVGPAVKMAGSGRYPFEELISHRFPLHEAEQALRLVAGETGGEMPLKVVLDFSS